jgi:hypothetical protein
MTPQQIADYKMRWMKESAVEVPIHSDLESVCKNWCKENLNQWQWKLTEWTNIYEHTFYFENELFAKEFNKWVAWYYLENEL